MGNLGVATSFFNEKNRNICSDLLELLIETKQEIPSFMEDMSSDRGHSGAKRAGRGGGGRYGGGLFFEADPKKILLALNKRE